MVKKFPLHPAHPERICWGCSRYCPVDDMVCGNGTIRAPHPIELFGDDWYLDAHDVARDGADEDANHSAV